MKKIYIGIDFSINSPGMCILHDSEYSFVSFVNTPKNLEKDKITKNLLIHKEISDENLCEVITYIRNKKDSIYSIDQSNKIKNAIDLGDIIINKLNKYIEKRHDVYIAIEGYSYNSKGNSFIDLIAFNTVLRERIYKLVGPKNFYIFSPSEIKKHAGKGNANKLMMKDYFLDNVLNDELLLKNKFYNWIMINKENIIDNKENIKKPIDDIIDAYFICKYLKYSIEKPV